MTKNVIWFGVMLSLLGFVPASNARADEWNKKTVLALSQPVETTPILAVTPDEQDVPVTALIQMTPLTGGNASGLRPSDRSDRSAPTNARQLPKTASALPLIVFLGFGSVAVAFGLLLSGRRAKASTV